jgi:hypothetical protein
MAVVLSALRVLVREMRQRRIERMRMAYRHGRVEFDVFVFTDEAPFCVLFGAKRINLAFELAVRPGFEIDTFLAPPTYKALCKALDVTFDPEKPFSVRAFLQHFSRSIPQALPEDCEALPHEVAAYRRDVEDSARIYFCGWRDNTAHGERVSETNLHKTQRLLGERAYQNCRRRNMSSCWTDDQSRRVDSGVRPE